MEPEINLIKTEIKGDAKAIEYHWFLGEVWHLDGTVTYAEPWMTREQIIEAHWPQEK